MWSLICHTDLAKCECISLPGIWEPVRAQNALNVVLCCELDLTASLFWPELMDPLFLWSRLAAAAFLFSSSVPGCRRLIS